ncbi:amidohydrolase family protein [Bradyrhizobium sp. LHD-71]|uniref:amidohydrolase family protein n=1 Tax=Bradyrhizobium sp. LHD-71 TaxID=3072141 RepID=UPI00280C780A|nr:amidohydrolase family protein [Bradyrhizobium sp. LHD-71]MDQ8731508.1 amidohydrolase family protein [Bradyrhizobium sp. LHD-71]
MVDQVVPANAEAGDELTAENTKAGMPPVQAATSRNRGSGPFKRLVLRGATVISGTGAPPLGPMDIVVEEGRITQIKKVGTPKIPIKPERRPAPGDHEIDCHGKYVTPGFIDCHAHAGVAYHALNGWVPPVDYVYKLWLAHGVTTVREMGSFNGLGWMLNQKALSAENKIAAPRLLAYAYFPAVNDRLKTIHTPEQAREWLRRIKARGADGVKFFGAPPAIMEAALDECGKLGLRSGCHHAQTAVTEMNALTSAKWGLTSAEHYYGLPEALFESRIIQDYSTDYDYNDEYFRFAFAGQTFKQAAKPGSAKWNEVLEAFLALDFTFVPTFTIYDANRDLMRARQADWHKEYTWKSMWEYFQPQRGGHGAYWYRWSTANEIDWKENYRLWMQFINEYKNRGGRVCTGSDSGFIFQIFGFGYVRELELLQEAGFHPLEVLRAATSQGAELIGLSDEIGSIDVGKRADLLVLDHNPLDDFKLLYGTGALRLNDETRKPEWHRALRYTIKDGVIYDVDELLADVREMVAASFAEDVGAKDTKHERRA